MVRYADDLLLFFSSEEEAKQRQLFVEEQLRELTSSYLTPRPFFTWDPQDNVAFLGLEIAFLEKLDKYVARISRHQIRKIQDHLEAGYSYEAVAKTAEYAK